MYGKMIDPTKPENYGIIRFLDGACLPKDPENVDYAAYLEWVAEGNTAEEWTSDA